MHSRDLGWFGDVGILRVWVFGVLGVEAGCQPVVLSADCFVDASVARNHHDKPNAWDVPPLFLWYPYYIPYEGLLNKIEKGEHPNPRAQTLNLKPHDILSPTMWQAPKPRKPVLPLPNVPKPPVNSLRLP